MAKPAAPATPSAPPTAVHMEALSPTMEEGRLVRWAKREGEPVKAGDVLAEVETDKAVMELVARADGQLITVLAPEGATVPVGTVVAYIGMPGAPVDGGSGHRAAAAAATKPVPEPTPAVAAVAAADGTGAGAGAAPAGGDRIKASPLARRMAREAGVDLQLVAGSGPGGRVVRRDLEGAAAQRAAPPAAAVPATGLPAVRAQEVVRGGPAYEDVPLTQIRKTIARRLIASLGPVPHFFITTEVDMERAAEAREALNRELGDQGKVSFNDIILKATALALTRHRACNAWFNDTHIRYWNDVHLGMAVAVEDGLITPVIRHADLKSLAQLSAEARELAQKARQRRLRPEEYTGSTFSMSNLGMFEIDQFTAVINPPEAGIIAVGTVAQKAVVVDGVVAARRRLRITMSCDHRVIDGATGAAFLRTLKQMLENPLAMLL